ncbi:MAG TPA: hypothetical protein VGC42_02760 [Kofleriaceae bacterium]
MKLATVGVPGVGGNAPSLTVSATLCGRSGPEAGELTPVPLSVLSVNSRSSHGAPRSISLVRIWLIAFWLPLAGAAGWHHHVSVVLCCYAFVIAERVRHFPPSARRPVADDAQSVAA